LHLFAHHWPSHETGLIKPDHAAFEQVVTALGIPPHRIVYVDDNQQNVDQACAVGLEAYRTVGLTAVMTKFTALGILENHL
jgi:putative hydrolase of the HAD superfamily